MIGKADKATKLLLAAACFSLVCAVFQSIPTRTAVPASAPSETQDSGRHRSDSGHLFLAALRARDPALAYGYLSTRLQKELSVEAFQSQIDDWMKYDINRWQLQHRVVSISGDTLELSPPVGSPNLGLWRWKLIQDDEGEWKIDSLGGLIKTPGG